jgi:hypothetical protein
MIACLVSSAFPKNTSAAYVSINIPSGIFMSSTEYTAWYIRPQRRVSCNATRKSLQGKTAAIIDALAITRLTRGLCAVALAKEQSGYPGFIKVVKIPGFPFSRE